MQHHRYDIDGGCVHCIEISEAAPPAALHQTAQNRLDTIEIGELRAIADQRENGKNLCQISNCFRFAAGRSTGNGATHTHCQRMRYRQMDFIRQRGHHESTIQTEILVSVVNVTRTVFDVEIIRFFEPMEAQLTLPQKIARIRDVLHDKRIDCISGMHFGNGNRSELESIVVTQIRTHCSPPQSSKTPTKTREKINLNVARNEMDRCEWRVCGTFCH